MAEIDGVLLILAQRAVAVVHLLVEPDGRLLGVNFLHVSCLPRRTALHFVPILPASIRLFAPSPELPFVLLAFSGIHDVAADRFIVARDEEWQAEGDADLPGDGQLQPDRAKQGMVDQNRASWNQAGVGLTRVQSLRFAA